jgi:hypothetical protein
VRDHLDRLKALAMAFALAALADELVTALAGPQPAAW